MWNPIPQPDGSACKPGRQVDTNPLRCTPTRETAKPAIFLDFRPATVLAYRVKRYIGSLRVECLATPRLRMSCVSGLIEARSVPASHFRRKWPYVEILASAVTRCVARSNLSNVRVSSTDARDEAPS